MPIPFLLVDVRYDPVGSASVFRYGVTWDAAMVPQSSSTSGTAFRVVIRRPGGEETVATIGKLDPGLFGQLVATSETTLRVAPGGGLWTLTTWADIPHPGSDWITVWATPSATVRTSYAGEKLVDWSVSAACPVPGLSCPGVQHMTFSASLLRREVYWTDWHEAYLDAIGPGAREALLAYDPRESGGTIAFPRYQLLASVDVGPSLLTPDTTWWPCADPDFEVLAETAVPLAGGDAFVVQYGVQADVLCTEQRPGFLVGTVTAGCSLHADVLVDRLGGALVMDPSAIADACTRR
ncbi:MAG TPA: hypothetical protein VFR85_13080 [Anaeromyxobacteraceae bacterium]|nr:hypothetical protein [Anaeromyxobacteraceae bacterium]